MKRFRFAPLALTLALFLIAACDTAVIGPDPVEPQTTGIVVASQGAFGQDTGGLVRYNLDGTTSGRYPGGGDGVYVQSADLHDGRLFVTTTSTVDVLDATTFERTARFTVPNPRYLAVDGNRAFVTSLYTRMEPGELFPRAVDGAVTRLAVPAGGGGMVEEQAIIGGNPEGIALAAGRLFVANHDFGNGTTVTVLDPETLLEIERIQVCDGPRFVFADVETEVVVVCEGGGFGDTATNGAFVVLDARTGAVVARTDLPTPLRTEGSGQTAAYAAETREVYAVANATRQVYRFDTRTNGLSGTFDVGGAPINAVAFDTVRQYLLLGRFAAEGNPYTEQGALTVHTRDGVLVDTFQGAGFAPTHIAVLSEILN